MKRKWNNPFFLVAQGFVAGAFLFFATMHQSSEARSAEVAGPGLAAEKVNKTR